MIDLMTLFVGLTAIVSSLGVLGAFIRFIIKISLKLIEKDINSIKQTLNNHITDLKAGQKELEGGQKKLEADNKELKDGQKKLEADNKRIESKVDKLLSKSG